MSSSSNPPTPIRFVVLAAVEAGVELRVEDGALRIRGPRRAALLATELRWREAEVLDYLLHDACPRCLGPLLLEESRERDYCTSCWLTEQWQAPDRGYSGKAARR